MNLEVEQYIGELASLREKVEVYEKLLHTLQYNACVLMDNVAVGDIIRNICDWSNSHRESSEYTKEEQQIAIRRCFDKLLTFRNYKNENN